MSLHYASMKTEDLRPDVLPAHSPQLVPAAQRLEQGPPCEHLGWGKLPLWEGIQRDHELQARQPWGMLAESWCAGCALNPLESVFSREAMSGATLCHLSPPGALVAVR